MAFGFSFAFKLLRGFWLGFGLISFGFLSNGFVDFSCIGLDFGWIWLGFRFGFLWISLWILHFRLLLLQFLFILASQRLS